MAITNQQLTIYSRDSLGSAHCKSQKSSANVIHLTREKNPPLNFNRQHGTIEQKICNNFPRVSEKLFERKEKIGVGLTARVAPVKATGRLTGALGALAGDWLPTKRRPCVLRCQISNKALRQRVARLDFFSTISSPFLLWICDGMNFLIIIPLCKMAVRAVRCFCFSVAARFRFLPESTICFVSFESKIQRQPDHTCRHSDWNGPLVVTSRGIGEWGGGAWWRHATANYGVNESPGGGVGRGKEGAESWRQGHCWFAYHVIMSRRW